MNNKEDMKELLEKLYDMYLPIIEAEEVIPVVNFFKFLMKKLEK